MRSNTEFSTFNRQTTHMNKLYRGILLTVLSFFAMHTTVLATHSAGGELYYVEVPGSPNTYQFTFRFYRDCGAVGQSTSIEPASFSLCYTSPCTGTVQNVTMPKIVGNIPTLPPVPNGSPLNDGCNSITTCDNINSTVHGYRQWWYSATVTLPTTYNAWRFWTTLCCRNDITGNITTPPGSQNLYVETTFDNTVSINNSSPVFLNSNVGSSLPVPYVCINMPYSHTGGAMDPDGDSLVYEVIQPRTLGGCTATAPTNILLPAYNLLATNGNPFPTNNTFNLNTTNSYFSFTPNQLGYYVLCIKVSEYRNGVLIGTNMRDMQIVVDNCVPLPVVSQLDSLSIVNGNLIADTVTTCPGSNLSFCFDIVDQVNPTANVMYMSSDYATVLPGSSVTFTNPTTNTLRVCVNWNSVLADTGTHVMTVYVKDTLDCQSSPGVSSVPIYVRKPLRAGDDYTMCYGDTTSLWCTGNGQYEWTVLPGGDNINSMSCTACDYPFVWPKKTTSYQVRDILCGFLDTVVVTIYNLEEPLPLFTLTPEQTTMDNPTFNMVNHSLYAVSYAWYDSSHNFLGNTKDLTVTENHTGVFCYTLEATSQCQEVRASTQCATIVGDGYLAFPTAFTPNGDGKNDNFLPIVIGDMNTSNYSFVIYNRWGMQVFASKDMKQGWNGKYKGKELEADTYYYYCEAYHRLNEKLVYKGDFILVR